MAPLEIGQEVIVATPGEKQGDADIVESPTEISGSTSLRDSDTSAEPEDESPDEEDEDDTEPTLKYRRLTGSLPNLLKKDSASALAISGKTIFLGTHMGFIHLLDMSGNHLRTYRPHSASVLDLTVDDDNFVASASMDGKVAIISTISTQSPENYTFDMKRPMRTIAMEPGFSKRSTRAFVCAGMAGELVLHEKGWLGHKQTILDQGEGPIWQARWEGRIIAWANDVCVKIYDTVSQERLTSITRSKDSPRTDLFRCNLRWEDPTTLIIAWANLIKVVRIRERPRATVNAAPSLTVEITAILQLDDMISGISQHPDMNLKGSPSRFLILAYTPTDEYLDVDQRVEDRTKQARKQAERPELRVLTRSGEELSNDMISVDGYAQFGCNDYSLVDIRNQEGCYVVLSPRDLVLVQPRDARDRVAWLLERERFEEALTELDILETEEGTDKGDGPSASVIGQQYIEHLVRQGAYDKAARLFPRVCGQDVERWEHWTFVFAERHQIQAIIPVIPIHNPQLGHLVYEMILGFFLAHDRETLLNTIKHWPPDIYDVSAVIVAIRSELDKIASSSKAMSPSRTPESRVLMECLAELYTLNKQPGKALPYYLRLRRPNVFELIRENNLFTDVRDQVLLLVAFDHELMEKRRKTGDDVKDSDSEAIELLVHNIHSIPINRVVQQLQAEPRYLYLYLTALAKQDLYLVSDYADLQVRLSAEHAPSKLIDFLRASSYYNLEAAYRICEERDLVQEMVFLLGKMGNNSKALTIIIERLADVTLAIEFAKEQADDDLWEDLLRYSETRPAFIRGLLENVGPEINPIRLIRRIKNGLEIPGLKEALIKILQDFQLQISLLEGCQTVLNGDTLVLSNTLQRNQTKGFFLTGSTACTICDKSVKETSQGTILMFLCRHIVHGTCITGVEVGEAPSWQDKRGRGLSGRIVSEIRLRARMATGCPECKRRSEGVRVST